MSTLLHSKKEGPCRQYDPPKANIDTLTQEQRKVFDVFIGIYTKILAGESSPHLPSNIDRTAGRAERRTDPCHLTRTPSDSDKQDPIRVVAPTDIVALNISGPTIQFAFGPTFNEFINKVEWLTERRLTEH